MATGCTTLAGNEIDEVDDADAPPSRCKAEFGEVITVDMVGLV